MYLPPPPHAHHSHTEIHPTSRPHRLTWGHPVYTPTGMVSPPQTQTCIKFHPSSCTRTAVYKVSCTHILVASKFFPALLQYKHGACQAWMLRAKVWAKPLSSLPSFFLATHPHSLLREVGGGVGMGMSGWVKPVLLGQARPGAPRLDCC